MSSYWISFKGVVYKCNESKIKSTVVLNTKCWAGTTTYAPEFSLSELQREGYIGIYPTDNIVAVPVSYIIVVPPEPIHISQCQIDAIRDNLNIKHAMIAYTSEIDGNINIHFPTVEFINDDIYLTLGTHNVPL